MTSLLHLSTDIIGIIKSYLKTKDLINLLKSSKTAYLLFEPLFSSYLEERNKKHVLLIKISRLSFEYKVLCLEHLERFVNRINSVSDGFYRPTTSKNAIKFRHIHLQDMGTHLVDAVEELAEPINGLSTCNHYYTICRQLEEMEVKSLRRLKMNTDT